MTAIIMTTRLSTQKVMGLLVVILSATLVANNILAADSSIAIPKSSSAAGAKVYIISPQDGEAVTNPVRIVFGLTGMGVAPAGVDKANTGHHHLLIDGADLPSFDVPMGSKVKHFGAGQTETALTLSTGKHTLQLILGDKTHIPHDPAVVSKKITIHVK